MTTDHNKKQEDGEKKLTETEQLKHNTRVAKAKQQAEDVSFFLLTRLRIMEQITKRSMQAIFISLGCLAVSIVGSVKGWGAVDLIGHVLWLVFFIGHLVCENIKSRAQGEFDGAWEMLCILGHAERDDEPPKGRKRKLKKRSMFARPKEFFERITKGKEAYGSV